MNSERMRVLKMLEEQKISSEEAARLLDALCGDKPGPHGNRLLKIRVWEGDSDKPKVNVSLPIKLVKWGLRFVPESARAKLDEKQIDLDMLSEALEKDITGKIVEVDDAASGDRVEIWLE